MEEQEEIKTGLDLTQRIVFRKGEILKTVERPYYSQMGISNYYYMVEDIIGNIIICSRVHKYKDGWKKIFKETFQVLDYVQGYIRRT